jgi:cytochrome c551/c552
MSLPRASARAVKATQRIVLLAGASLVFLIVATAVANVVRNDRGPITNEQVPQVMSAARCFGCHDKLENRIGPPYVAIKSRYQNDPRAVENLSEKIVAGGAGNWGVVPMVANTAVTLDQARVIVKWILTQSFEAQADDKKQAPQ